MWPLQLAPRNLSWKRSKHSLLSLCLKLCGRDNRKVSQCAMSVPSSRPQFVCKHPLVDAAKRANVHTVVIGFWIDNHQTVDSQTPWEQLRSDLKKCVSETPDDVMSRPDRQLGDYFSKLLKLPTRLSAFPSLRRQLKTSGGIGPRPSDFPVDMHLLTATFVHVASCEHETVVFRTSIRVTLRQSIPDFSFGAACCREWLCNYKLCFSEYGWFKDTQLLRG